jgi:hypothetical protein
MSNEAQQDEILGIKEEPDGSVTVEMPVDEHQDDDAPQQNDDRSQDAAPADEDADHQDDTDAIRAAKRARRRAKRESAKQHQIEKDHRLSMLQRQNEELLQRLAVIERKTHAGELAQMDEAIRQAATSLEYAKIKMSQATSEQDGEGFTKAQEMWYDARQKIEALQNLKKVAAQPRAQQSLPNPKIANFAQRWQQRNPWFDPGMGDLDSRLTKEIDEDLVRQGWDPADEQYWDELDRRLRQHLPNRYNQAEGGSASKNRPRYMQSSTGRESAAAAGGRQVFMLEPEQVKAIKDAGLWDDEKARNRIIAQYAKQQKRA